MISKLGCNILCGLDSKYRTVAAKQRLSLANMNGDMTQHHKFTMTFRRNSRRCLFTHTVC